MNPKRWLHEHSLKLLAIRDTPEAIAGGVAIGIFMGFTPLVGFKTLLTLLFAWLTRSNLVAAFVGSVAHDLLFLFMPVIYRWEYDIGYWLLSSPHHFPVSLRKMHLDPHIWRDWKMVITVGEPLMLGSIIVGGPIALATFFLIREFVSRNHRKKLLEEAQPAPVP